MMKVVELTKENEEKYLNQVAELEQVVLESMKKEGREGQLFATGKEDISGYVQSKENTVMVAVNEDDEVEAATYVTQGQKPFTYNDITKYFKYGDKYKTHIKTQYPEKNAYKKDLLDTYQLKLKAYQYARDKILSEHPEVESINQYLEQEMQANGFHEKSELREMVNQYMSEYIETLDKRTQENYERFYWITTEDIEMEFDRKIKSPSQDIQEYEQFIQKEYETIIKRGKLKIYEQPEFKEEQYYSANTGNSIELDTYITSPQNRNSGIARIIVYEGIKKHMEEYFKNPDNSEIFLCSTLHRDNLSSKYVSEFFGLTDSLYVNRRQGRDREVHMCRIPREKAMEYLVSMSDKLAVLYGYNPNQKHITQETRKRVLKEQIEYETREFKRLVTARPTNKKFKGNINNKKRKIRRLKEELEKVQENRGGESHGE